MKNLNLELFVYIKWGWTGKLEPCDSLTIVTQQEINNILRVSGFIDINGLIPEKKIQGRI